MAEKLTVIIPCKDEEANIRGCIHSAGKVADEIVIADSGSTDQTLQIARGMGGVRIIEREYVNSGDFKNWAIPQATHDWVLILDADERIPDQLADEINELLQRGPDHDGYWVYRASFFMGHRVRFSGWQNDRVLRLFRRDLGTYRGDYDHAEVAIRSGRVSRVKNRLLHYSYWTYHDYFQRMQRYSTYQAVKWQEQGRRISFPKLFFNFPLRFLQLYIMRLGFLDGLVGFQVCLLTAMYSFSKQACLWQLLHGRSRIEANRDAVDVLVATEPLLQPYGVESSGVDDMGQSRVSELAASWASSPAAGSTRNEVSLSADVLRPMTFFRRASGTPEQGRGGAVFIHRISLPASIAAQPSAGQEGGRNTQPSELLLEDCHPSCRNRAA